MRVYIVGCAGEISRHPPVQPASQLKCLHLIGLSLRGKPLHWFASQPAEILANICLALLMTSKLDHHSSVLFGQCCFVVDVICCCFVVVTIICLCFMIIHV